ncbi:MAG: hypothetical protein KTR23_09080 [Rhodospirillales bacterium]|nr:hypothetical protein [Rhodospirillales bacterium]
MKDRQKSKVLIAIVSSHFFFAAQSANADPVEIQLVISNPEIICGDFSATVWLKKANAPNFDIALMNSSRETIRLEECGLGTKVGIKPNSVRYRDPKGKFCTAGEMPFRLQARDISCKTALALNEGITREETKSVALAVIDALDRNSPAEAAFASNELLARLKGTLPNDAIADLSSFSVSQTSLAMAEPEVAHDQTTPSEWTYFDQNQGKVVFSPAGVDRLKNYQINQNIPETGKADWKTLEALSGKNINDLNNGYGAASPL